jgi:hypothetical protein
MPSQIQKPENRSRSELVEGGGVPITEEPKDDLRAIILKKLAERTTIEINVAACLRSAAIGVALIIAALRTPDALKSLIHLLAG